MINSILRIVTTAIKLFESSNSIVTTVANVEDKQTIFTHQLSRSSELELNTSSFEVSYSFHTDDYYASTMTRQKYKIDNHSVYVQLIEWEEVFLGSSVRLAIDGVFLQSEINDYTKDMTPSALKNFNLKIDMAKKAVVGFHELEDYDWKYFIFSKHPEIISNSMFKQIVRTERERLLFGVQCSIKELKEASFVVEKIDDGYVVSHGSVENIWTNNPFMEEFHKKYGITLRELYIYELIVKRLDKWLQVDDKLAA